MNASLRPRLTACLLPAVTAAALIVLWYVIKAAFRVPTFVLPAPHEILVAAWEERAFLWPAALVTVRGALLGFSAAVGVGFLLAMALGFSPRIKASFYPLILVKDNFKVMVYCSDDPIAARQLEDIGCCAVMPLASLIGSGMGILNPLNLQLIVDRVRVPVIVDAGVGTASDAAIAMELGCHGVLMNTAIAAAQNPVLMASAMEQAVKAGRMAFLAGRMPRRLYSASPSSPSDGLIS